MLTGQAKTDYQRAYMRDYMRQRRASQSVGGAENASKGVPGPKPKPQDGPGRTISLRPDIKTHPLRPVRPWPYIPVPDDYDLDEALSHPLPDFDADGNLIPEIE